MTSIWQLRFTEGIIFVKLKGKHFKFMHRQHSRKKFYSLLDNEKTQCKSQEITIVMGDWNVTVSKDRDSEIFDKFGSASIMSS